MKKTACLLAILLSSTQGIASQPDQKTDVQTNQNPSFYQSVKSGWNSFLDVLAGKGSRYSANNHSASESKKVLANSPSKVNETTASSGSNPIVDKTKAQGVSSTNDSSVYNSIKSGWNSFIDFLTGTKR